MRDIHARRPVDRTASRVTSEGEHYDPDVKRANVWDSDLPIQTVASPRDTDDLTGRRVGRLIVIGYHGTTLRVNGEIKHHRWTMRCACGNWTVRKGRAIKNPKRDDDCCDKCSYVRSVKYKYNNKI